MRHLFTTSELSLSILLSKETEQAAKHLWDLMKTYQEDDSILSAIHTFYEALFFTEHPIITMGEGHKKHPMNIFCLCLCLDQTGRFQPCNQLTPKLSGLQYMMRLSGLAVLNKRSKELNEPLFE